jgi:hypothetical protein
MASYLQDSWRTLPGNALVGHTIQGRWADRSESVTEWEPERSEQRFDFGHAPPELQALQGKYTHSYVDPQTKRLSIMGLQRPGAHKYDVFSLHYNLDPESGQYVLDSADEQKMKSTASKLAKTIGPVLAVGAAGALASAAGGGSAGGAGAAGGTAGGTAGTSAFGGSLPTFGAELGANVFGGTSAFGGALPTFGAELGANVLGGTSLVGGTSAFGGALPTFGAELGANVLGGTSLVGGTSAFGGALPTFGAELGANALGGTSLVGGTDLVGSSLLTGGTGFASGGPGFTLPGGATAGGSALKGGGGGLIEKGLGWLAEQAGFPEVGKWLEGSGVGRDLLGLFGSGMQQWNIEKVAADQRKWIDSKEAAARQRRAPVRGTAGALRVVGG